MSLKFKNENQRKFYDLIKADNDIVFCNAKAGVGKTYISLFAALQDIYDRESPYNKIVVITPTVTVGGEDELGFMPGDLEQKIERFTESMTFILNKIVGERETKRLIEKKIIEFKVSNYLRGNNFEKQYCIIDEAQNLSAMQIKTILTRWSTDVKMILQGDLSQCDKFKDFKKSGFYDAWHKLLDVQGIGFIQFDKDDCIRSGIVKRVLERYESELDVVLPTTQKEYDQKVADEINYRNAIKEEAEKTIKESTKPKIVIEPIIDGGKKVSFWDRFFK
jgi:phosphate starvation-inducible PhoH-like protein